MGGVDFDLGTVEEKCDDRIACNTVAVLCLGRKTDPHCCFVAAIESCCRAHPLHVAAPRALCLLCSLDLAA